MKAAKRQTRSRDLEAEQNDMNEKKKPRLSSEADVSSENNSVAEADGVTDNSEANGDSSMPELEPVTNSNEPTTSTPIVHNGNVGNLASKFNNSELPEKISASPDAAPESQKVDGDKEMASPDENESEVQNISNGESADVVTEVQEPTNEPIYDSHDIKYDAEAFLSSSLEVYELEGHADCITAVAADGDTILSASHDTTIKLWDPYKKKEVRNFQGHTGSVTSLVLLSEEESSVLSTKMNFADTTRVVISGSSDCSIRLWSVSEGAELLSIYTYNGITSLGYMGDQNYIVVGTDGGKLELWDLKYSKVLYSVVAHEGPVVDLKVDGCYIYTASPDGKVKVWLFEDDDLQPIYSRSRKSPSPDGEMTPTLWKCVASHDDILFLGDDTSDLKVLDWKKGRIRIMKNQVKPNGTINAVFLKNDVLLSSFFDPSNHTGGINVWQLPNIGYICTLTGDLGMINSVALTDVHSTLRVVSGGSKLTMWDFCSSKPPTNGESDKYTCQEICSIGEETSISSTDSGICRSVTSTHPSIASDTGRSRRCILL